jgi:hypothetical protein
MRIVVTPKDSTQTHAQDYANTSGRGSRRTATGSTSLSANDLALTADELTEDPERHTYRE